MRFSLPLAVLVFLTLTRAASADIITESFAFSGSLGSPVSIFGNLFNPALGTLEGVTIGIHGTFQANFYIPQPLPPLLQDDVTASITTPQQSASYNFGYFPITATNETYTGSTTFSAEFDLSSFQDYVSGYPPSTGLLAEIGMQDYVNARFGVFDEYSTYSGTLLITYDYAVPEPSSLHILGAGVAALLIGASATRRIPHRFRNILPV